MHPLIVFLISMPGGTEWLIIILIILLFFGGKKIPDLMRGLGRGVKEFKDAKNDTSNKTDTDIEVKQTEEKK